MNLKVNQNRDALIDQLRHLIDEIDALSGQIGHIPEEYLSARAIAGEPSIKEVYALIGLHDLHVYRPALEAMLEEALPELQEREDMELLDRSPWTGKSFDDVLSLVQESRRQLIDCLEEMAPDDWHRRALVGERNLNVHDVVYAVIQHDADLLRGVATRLHESRLPRTSERNGSRSENSEPAR